MKFWLINDFILYLNDHHVCAVVFARLLPLVHTFIDKNQRTTSKHIKRMLASWQLETMHTSHEPTHWSAMSLHIDWMEKCQVIAIMGVLKCAK